MRPVLIRILLDQPWTLWTPDVDGVPGVGAGILWLVLGLLGAAYIVLRRRFQWTADDRANVVIWLVVLTAIAVGAPRLAWNSVPVFGYGVMVLLGFLAATWFGQFRARQEGLDPEIVFSATFATLLCGVIGGRALYATQHRAEVFSGVDSLGEFLFAAVNISNGGLTLIGAMLGGAVGYFSICRKRRVPPLMLLDVLAPSIFIGVGFGRIGCLLYGCCFGDPSTLPWAIRFPSESAAFKTLVARGFVSPDADLCMPLHPTQIYSSFNAFLLAGLVWAYYPFRRHVGSAFALGLICYPITRFFIEFLRADELGQLGTRLTISQLLSLGLLLVGLSLAAWLNWRGEPVNGSSVRLSPASGEGTPHSSA